MPVMHRMRVSRIKNDTVVFCVGSRGSGKTSNIIEILSQKRDQFSYGVVMCGTAATSKQYEEHVPATFVYYQYSPHVLKALLDDQERKVYEGRAKWVFVVLDDVLWKRRAITQDPTFIRLCNNGRHAKIFLIVSVHYAYTMPPELRQSIDWVFLSREKNPRNIERLFYSFNPCVRTPEQWEHIFRQCTQHHETLVVDNHSGESDAIEDNLYWFKSKPGEGRKFRMNKTGTWWKYHDAMFDTQYYLREPVEEPDETPAKRRKRMELTEKEKAMRVQKVP
jgi:hypothetical protein